MKNPRFSLRKRLQSFKYAFRGLQTVIAFEHNAWIHSVVAILVIIAGFVLGIDKSGWIAVVLCIGGVYAAEIFNSSIENLCDHVSPEENEKIGKIKDMAAAAVLISALAAAIVGCIVFIPKIITLCSGN